MQTLGEKPIVQVGDTTYRWIGGWAKLPDNEAHRKVWPHTGIVATRQDELVTFDAADSKLVALDIWLELASTYVGLDTEDNWAALFRTVALFRRVATDVGEALGYTYPQHLHDRVTAYLTAVRRTPRRAVPLHSDD